MKKTRQILTSYLAIIAIPTGLTLSGCMGGDSFTNSEINKEFTTAFGEQFKPYGEITIEVGEYFKDYAYNNYYHLIHTEQNVRPNLFAKELDTVKRINSSATDWDEILSPYELPEYTKIECSNGDCKIHFPEESIYKISKTETMEVLKKTGGLIIEELQIRYEKALARATKEENNAKSWSN